MEDIFKEEVMSDEAAEAQTPVLFGGGTRMFDNLKVDHTRLHAIEVVHAPAATHLRFRVLKPDTAHA